MRKPGRGILLNISARAESISHLISGHPTNTPFGYSKATRCGSVSYPHRGAMFSIKITLVDAPGCYSETAIVLLRQL